jgi:hypothetical protein
VIRRVAESQTPKQEERLWAEMCHPGRVVLLPTEPGSTAKRFSVPNYKFQCKSAPKSAFKAHIELHWFSVRLCMSLEFYSFSITGHCCRLWRKTAELWLIPKLTPLKPSGLAFFSSLPPPPPPQNRTNIGRERRIYIIIIISTYLCALSIGGGGALYDKFVLCFFSAAS